MTTPPPTADPFGQVGAPELPAPGWLPDEATLNRWAGAFYAALPDEAVPVSSTAPLADLSPHSDLSAVGDAFPRAWPGPSTPHGAATPYGAGPAPAPHGSSVPAPELPWLGAATPISGSPTFYFLDRPADPQTNAPPGWAENPRPAAVLPGSAAGFDINAVRADFPILSERVDGKQLVWLDNAATTQKPQAVIDRLAYFYAHENSNIHRAAHTLAARATDAYEDARDTVARFIGAPSADEIVFVRGATEAINLVAQAWGRKNISEGDEILISHLEHHANIVPWQQLTAEKGAVLRVIPVDDDGRLIMSEFSRLLGPRTKLVAVTHVSNALGTVTPVKAIIDEAHRAGARVLIDGAQSVPHLKVDVADLGPDFYLFSGHKIFGPTGIGVLYGTSEVLESMPPWQGGGNMITNVTLQHSEFQKPPGRFEAGTGNIADAVGLGAALKYLERFGIENLGAYEHSLLEYAMPRMRQVPGLHLIGTAPDKASVLSFVLDGYSTEQVGSALNADGIAVRAGHHCAQPILDRFGLTATVRPSLAFYNTCEEIDAMLEVLHRLASDVGRPAHDWNWSQPPSGPQLRPA